jgi:hypothetical protein
MKNLKPKNKENNLSNKLPIDFEFYSKYFIIESFKEKDICIKNIGVGHPLLPSPCNNNNNTGDEFLWRLDNFNKKENINLIISKIDNSVFDNKSNDKSNGNLQLSWWFNGGNNQKWAILTNKKKIYIDNNNDNNNLYKNIDTFLLKNIQTGKCAQIYKDNNQYSLKQNKCNSENLFQNFLFN